jgi:hypothetical protein
MKWTIKVHIEPFVKKFIAGQGYDVNNFVITKNCKYGIFLFNCLEKANLKLIKREREFEWDADYSDTLTVYVSENFWQKKGNIIMPEKQMDFNKMVNYDFHEEFYRYVKNRIDKKGSINKAIHTFRDSYDITEDDLSFWTIQRAFQRRQRRIMALQSA